MEWEHLGGQGGFLPPPLASPLPDLEQADFEVKHM